MKICLRILCGLFCYLMLGLNTIYGNENNQPTVTISPSSTEDKVDGCAEYLVHFEDFPLNKKIDVFFHRVIQANLHSYRKVEEITLHDDGLKTINGKNCLKYCLNPAGFAPGERVTYHYRLGKNRIVAQTSYIPNPIHIESEQRTFSIDAELSKIIPTTIYSITFEGLENGEKVHIKTLSDTQFGEHVKNFRKDEIFYFYPETEHEKGGLSTLEITRSSGDKIILKANWGSNILAELMNTEQTNLTSTLKP